MSTNGNCTIHHWKCITNKLGAAPRTSAPTIRASISLSKISCKPPWPPPSSPCFASSEEYLLNMWRYILFIHLDVAAGCLKATETYFGWGQIYKQSLNNCSLIRAGWVKFTTPTKSNFKSLFISVITLMRIFSGLSSVIYTTTVQVGRFNRIPRNRSAPIVPPFRTPGRGLATIWCILRAYTGSRLGTSYLGMGMAFQRYST